MGIAAGQYVGDYRIAAVVGEGAGGRVFKAEHIITRRTEALKVLARALPDTKEEEQRFLREIQVQASLDHPNIAAVRTAFWTTDGPVLVMEYVEGESLEAVLSRGRLPLADALGIIRQTLDALIYAHEHSVIHRDLKPGNILITRDGTVKLTDFGLARHRAVSTASSGSGGIAGTPYYMSPEQIIGTAPIDARTDIYSAGCVLYECATGWRPFEGPSAFEIMLAHRESAPQSPRRLEPSLPGHVEEVILRAMEKDPARRFQSAREFRDALERAATRMGATNARSAPVWRRWPVWASLVALIGLALIWFGLRMAAQRPAPAPAAKHTLVPPPASLPKPSPAKTVQPMPAAGAAVEPVATAPAPSLPGGARKGSPRAAESRPSVTGETQGSQSTHRAASPEPDATAMGSAAQPGDDTANTQPKKDGSRVKRAFRWITKPFRSSKPDSGKPPAKDEQQ